MTTSKALLALTILSGSTFAFGCGGAGMDEPVGDTATAVSASAPQKLSGTYEAVGTSKLDVGYYSFDFHTNGDFTATGGCPQTGPGPHCYAITVENGTFKVSRSADTHAHPEGLEKVVLTSSLGETVTYYYSVSGNTLALNKTPSGPTAYFYSTSWTKKIPIGDVCEDNNGNSLGECADSGNFACGSDGIEGDPSECLPLD